MAFFRSVSDEEKKFDGSLDQKPLVEPQTSKLNYRHLLLDKYCLLRHFNFGNSLLLIYLIKLIKHLFTSQKLGLIEKEYLHGFDNKVCPFLFMCF